MTSEFGRGYATCLLQFSNHESRLHEYIGAYKDLKFIGIERTAEIWMNGASDHLYELKKPVRLVPLSEWKTAAGLQARALDIGHGFRPSSAATTDECFQLLYTAKWLLGKLEERGLSARTLDEAFVTDRLLGLRPDSGQWDCPMDFVRNP